MKNFGELEAHFHSYNDLPAQEQAGYLARMARDQPSLYRQFSTMLEKQDAADALFESPLMADVLNPLRGLSHFLAACVVHEQAKLPVPKPSIAGYEILECLGEGGMGIVYLAQQKFPTVRKVALKIVRPGLGDLLFLGRHQAERQALGLMEHDGIARLFESGVTTEKRPYFTMEYINGPSLTHYCREQDLDLHARLGLMLQVCRAVQHAHARGVIHGDLKPSNLLMALDQHSARCKIIDFGIARACDDLTAQLLQASGDLTLGSPAFMSPEQKLGKIDTRCDVYALGAVLALVVGKADTPDIAKAHQQTQGEVRWILDKALMADPDRRYATAKELGDDLERLLNHQVLSVAPASWRYRTRSWLRRHPLLASGLMGLILTLIALLIGIIRTDRERNRTALALAQLHKAHAFYNDVFRQPHPFNYGGQIKFIDVLKTWEEALPSYAANDPSLEARVRITLGETYLGLGQNRQAADHFQRALAIYTQHLGEDQGDIQSARTHLARALRRQGQTQEALNLLQTALSWQAQHLAPNHPERLRTLTSLAAVSLDQGKAEQALSQVQALKRLLDPRDAATRLLGFDVAEIEANALLHQGHRQQALQCQQRLLRQQLEQLGANHPRVSLTQQNLASALDQLKRYKEAEMLYREIIAKRQKQLGPDHPYSLGSRHGLVLTLYHQKRYGDAEAEASDCFRRMSQNLGTDHPATLSLLNTRAAIAGSAGSLAQATALYQALVQAYASADQKHSLAYARALNNYGHFLGQAGKVGAALEALIEAESLKAKLEGPAAVSTLITIITKAQVFAQAGRHQEAEQFFENAVTLLDQNHPDQTDLLAETLCDRGECALRQGKWQQAEQALQRALTLTQPKSEVQAQIRAHLVDLYTKTNRPDSASRFR